MLRFKFRAAMLLTLIVLASASIPAHATTITTYSSLAAFQNAATILQTIDFSSVPVSNFTFLNNNNVQFTLFGNGYPSGVLDTAPQSWTNFGTGRALYLYVNGAGMPYIHIVLPAPVTAVSMNLFSSSPNALAFTVTVAGLSSTVPTFTTPTPAFFGVTSDTPFTTVDLSLAAWNSNLGATQYLDNFSTATALPTDTPEAATFLLIGSGLIGLIGWRRRMSKRNLAPHTIPAGPVLTAC